MSFVETGTWNANVEIKSRGLLPLLRFRQRWKSLTIESTAYGVSKGPPRQDPPGLHLSRGTNHCLETCLRNIWLSTRSPRSTQYEPSPWTARSASRECVFEGHDQRSPYLAPGFQSKT